MGNIKLATNNTYILLQIIPLSLLVSMAFGAFNGVLVAYFKIQPMIATLILFTAGRSIAAWINHNELPIIKDAVFSYFGNFIPGIALPTPVFIAILCMIISLTITKSPCDACSVKLVKER